MTRMLMAALALLLFATGLAAAEWSGTVVAIADGDTLSVMRDGAPVKIRLWGIDCPEARKPFGTAARRFLGDRAHGRTATVHERDRDRYGRVVAIVEVDGVNLNRELVVAGMAWVYVRYCREPERAAWLALEAEAQVARRGVWSHPDPVPPWDWRQQRRTVSGRPSSSIFATTTDAAVATPVAVDELAATPSPYLGNRRSRVFHRSTCPRYQQPKTPHPFDDAATAQQEGYRPCAFCRPLARASPVGKPVGGNAVPRVGDLVAAEDERPV